MAKRRTKHKLRSLYALRRARPASLADGPGVLYAYVDYGRYWKIGMAKEFARRQAQWNKQCPCPARLLGDEEQASYSLSELSEDTYRAFRFRLGWTLVLGVDSNREAAARKSSSGMRNPPTLNIIMISIVLFEIFPKISQAPERLVPLQSLAIDSDPAPEEQLTGSIEGKGTDDNEKENDEIQKKREAADISYPPLLSSAEIVKTALLWDWSNGRSTSTQSKRKRDSLDPILEQRGPAPCRGRHFDMTTWKMLGDELEGVKEEVEEKEEEMAFYSVFSIMLSENIFWDRVFSRLVKNNKEFSDGFVSLQSIDVSRSLAERSEAYMNSTKIFCDTTKSQKVGQARKNWTLLGKMIAMDEDDLEKPSNQDSGVD
ncbi:hypothetical protein EV361DRAFT_864457 [Lentinula raphanica]|nr:hypothetical protein EV361DRAFT_864457 [Lentinula raphanica]